MLQVLEQAVIHCAVIPESVVAVAAEIQSLDLRAGIGRQGEECLERLGTTDWITLDGKAQEIPRSQ